jgi:hypothetical protein
MIPDFWNHLARATVGVSSVGARREADASAVKNEYNAWKKPLQNASGHGTVYQFGFAS